MKIGIMSMQRINNYGSFLQAYGLKRIIEDLGHNVEFVDYEFEKSIIKTKKTNRRISNILKTKNILKKIKVRKEFNNKFSLLQSEYFGKLNYHPSDIDELVIGSDEVFNCLQEYPVGYSRELFGKNYENIPVISYAASFGQTTYNRLKEYSINNEVGELLNKFRAISVRDNNSFEIVKQLTNKEVNVNLDPVLIYDYKNEIIDNVKLKNYIIVYAYSHRLTKKEEKVIKQFAKKHNKKIISFGMYQNISDYELVINPFEIFAYFKHADFIITDTFHGSIFSIKSHSNFCTIIRNSHEGNSNKLYDLLDRLSLTERVINDIDDLEKIYNKEIDYSNTDTIINKNRENTINYLKKEIKK